MLTFQILDKCTKCTDDDDEEGSPGRCMNIFWKNILLLIWGNYCVYPACTPIWVTYQYTVKGNGKRYHHCVPRDCEKCVFTKLVRYENCVIFWNNCSFYIIIKSSSSSSCLWAADDMLLLMAWHNPLKYIVTFISHRHFGWNNFPGFFSCTCRVLCIRSRMFLVCLRLSHLIFHVKSVCLFVTVTFLQFRFRMLSPKLFLYVFVGVLENRNTFLLAVKRIFLLGQ